MIFAENILIYSKNIIKRFHISSELEVLGPDQQPLNSRPEHWYKKWRLPKAEFFRHMFGLLYNRINKIFKYFSLYFSDIKKFKEIF